MKIGIVTPVVTRVPGSHGPWESAAGISQLALVARTADQLGFDHLTCSEHVAVPTAVADQRGGTYWDPLSTLGYLAAHTERIRLATQVLVLGYHHPLEIAKRYGTLDVVSGGRLVLGLGVGSLEEEFTLLDVPFAGRGERADDALAALRASLSRTEPEYHGPHYDFGDVMVDPCAVQPRVPLWIGGRSKRSLRRSVELGDGWMPFGLSLAELGSMVAATDVPAGFEVVLPAGRPLDALDDAAAVRSRLDRLHEAGATIVSANIRASNVDHYCEQLEALATIGGLS